MDPMDVGTIDGLASAYSANGQLAEATTEFQRALAIEPYIPAYNGLGLVAVKQHDFVTARKNFERAIQLDPKDAESQLNLGVLCMQTGDASVWTSRVSCISGECFPDAISRHDSARAICAENGAGSQALTR